MLDSSPTYALLCVILKYPPTCSQPVCLRRLSHPLLRCFHSLSLDLFPVHVCSESSASICRVVAPFAPSPNPMLPPCPRHLREFAWAHPPSHSTSPLVPMPCGKCLYETQTRAQARTPNKHPNQNLNQTRTEPQTRTYFFTSFCISSVGLLPPV